jgi:hypothetical protein
MTKKLTHKKSKKIIRGGDMSENISNTLLANSIISYLPTTETVKKESKIRDYLSSIDALTLLEIIGSDEKYLRSKSLNYLIDSIDKNTLEVIKNMGNAIKIPSIRKDIETFEVDCTRLSKKTSVKELLELPNFLLDCNTSLCNRNLDWYDVILGFRKLDDGYEELVKKEIFDKKIIINTNKTLNARDKLRRNERVREIMKRRILKCCKDPRSFFDKLKGTVAWIDYNHCTSCSSDDCILYIDQNYREFLMMDLGISSVKKLKILIFVEIRIHLLSKFVFIEAIRISGERKRKIKILVEKIYRNDSKNGRIVTNTQSKKEKMYGGDNENSSNIYPPPPESSVQPPMNSEPSMPMNSELSMPMNSEPSLPTNSEPSLPANSEPSLPTNSESSIPTEDIPKIDDDKQKPEEMNETKPVENVNETGESQKEEDVTVDEDEDEELVIYLTYNILKDIDDINNVKRKIITSVKRISHITDINTIMIGNPNGTDEGFRKGFCTYSFEVTISKSNVENETFDSIKDAISDSINDGSFENIMNINKNTLTLRDVYFTGLNGRFDDNRLRHKRALADIRLPYPQGGHKEKMDFSRKIKKLIYDSIAPLFDDFKLSKRRVQLELISSIDDDNSSVLVQFMIMDSYSKLESSYSIAQTISQNLTSLKSNPIEEINMLDKCHIFDIDTVCNASKKKLIDLGVKKVGIQKDNINVVNNNCNEVIENLRNNYVSNINLSENCSDAIDKELGINTT